MDSTNRAKIDIIFFDMDHTVLDTDCDISWKFFLADEGLAPDSDRAEAKRFFDLYHQGRTPVPEWIKFQLREFVNRTPEEMQKIADRHYQSRIREYVYPEARREIKKYRSQGMPTILLTGTSRIIAEPIARALGVTHLLATEPEIIDGHFTGGIVGPFLMREGKLNAAINYCRENHFPLDRVAFYADSITDVTLLEKVASAVVVNPGDELLSLAHAHHWRIVNWSIADKPSPFPKPNSGSNQKTVQADPVQN